MSEQKPRAQILASNRKARHDYHVLERLEAGLALQGTEVKAAREGRVQLKDAWVEVRGNEAWLVGMHIGPYRHGHRENHEPERERKLLLKRREIDHLLGSTQRRGLTAVPLSIYLKGHLIKAEIALVRGKRQYDKRETIRRREQEREAERAVKERRW